MPVIEQRLHFDLVDDLVNCPGSPYFKAKERIVEYLTLAADVDQLRFEVKKMALEALVQPREEIDLVTVNELALNWANDGDVLPRRPS